MKDWEDVSDKVTFPNNARHGSAFKVSNEVFETLTQLK